MGRYDPPDKAQLMSQFRRTPSMPELMVAATEAQFPPKVSSNGDASRAILLDNGQCPNSQPQKRGRKTVVTAAKVQRICELLSLGESECSACVRAGIGLTAWNAAKRDSVTIRERIASARDDWARLRHARLVAARYESQAARDASRKALRPEPIRQAKWMVWNLATRVPLNFVVIPEGEIASACKRCGLHLETWRRQDAAFGLMRKIYEKRAKIRGEQPSQQLSIQPPIFGFQDTEVEETGVEQWTY
jgi:hypothetical protein